MANYLSQIQAQYANYLQNERSIQAEIDMFNRQLAAQQAQQAKAAAYSSGGSSGGSGYSSETADLQKQLNAMGANLTVDGVWGPQTQAAYDRYMNGGDTSGYTLTNRNGNGWIALDGGGRYSYSELQKMLDNGQVKEVVNDWDRTVSYGAREITQEGRSPWDTVFWMITIRARSRRKSSSKRGRRKRPLPETH